MAILVPDPKELGLSSPALGPWFENNAAFSLAPPEANLSVEIVLIIGGKWLAPASGTISFNIASEVRPQQLENLRQENGNLAFSLNSFVVLLTLLPEVEQRLHSLMNKLPSADGSSNNALATRAKIRYFALEFNSSDVASLEDIEKLIPNGFPNDLSNDALKAEYLGLQVKDDALVNSSQKRAAHLARPSKNSIIIENNTSSGINAFLWAFDHNGRPIDPGAVASWYTYLANEHWENLWEDPSTQATVLCEQEKTIHIVNAHEGPIAEDLKSRLDTNGMTTVPDSHALYSTNAPIELAITTAPSPDNAPLPRLALLPNANYVELNSTRHNPIPLWHNSSLSDPLDRDFVRLALVDLEQQLVGLDRSNALQESASTRIEVRQNTKAEPFLHTADEVAQAIITNFSDDNPSTFVTPTLDLDWGPLPQVDLGSQSLSENINFEVKAISGEGETSANGDTVINQSVVFIFDDVELPENTWIRVWPKGLDSQTGRHFLLDGGAGRVNSNGQAWVVVPLPDGTFESLAPMACNIAMVSDIDSQYFEEQRFSRPALISGSRFDLPPSNTPINAQLHICETGRSFDRSNEPLGSGQTLLAITGSAGSEIYQLVNEQSLEISDLSPQVIANLLSANDTVILTKPAYGASPEGSVTDTLPNNAKLVYRDRSGFIDTELSAGRPVPGMERNEVAALNTESQNAVVGGAQARAKVHEALPSQLGHPGVPAAKEVHALGLAIEGPAIVPVAEHLRERVSINTIELALAAATKIEEPQSVSGPTKWTSVLDTMTHSVAADAALRDFIENSGPIALGQTWDSLKSEIQTGTGADLDSALNQLVDTDSLKRAFEKIAHKTSHGAHEGLNALLGAIRRAEDFIYIETPCIDNETINDTSFSSIVLALTQRIEQRPALKVVLCVPERYLPNQPKALERIRQSAISDALFALRGKSTSNIVLITPTAGPGRYLHLSTSAVIVDDVFALIGTTHLWRRGLTFDSSIAATLFDESLVQGRCASIVLLRRQLLAERLNLSLDLVPNDMAETVFALAKLNQIGGLGRVKANAFPAKRDESTSTLKSAWNPDGSLGNTPSNQWFNFFSNIDNSTQDGADFSNAVR
ncbi:hypothetical protein DBZ36_05230 [Alginatibacterium sediminis]|uniref:Uncharacterized protein n=1 Tax=Alginatibacterium sediminis TaxID=2164068 RepID=A0A420EGM0_9ALTE|nr:hypothetical protein [Alginatibacterium sediminis]RKF19862.1 hypothetical protein DBZ36_05230 [Alginatibacterium sediminis]